MQLKKTLRKDAISAILATDMKSHFSLVSMFGTKFSAAASAASAPHRGGGSSISGHSRFASSSVATIPGPSTGPLSSCGSGSLLLAPSSSVLFQVLDEDLRSLVLQVGDI